MSLQSIVCFSVSKQNSKRKICDVVNNENKCVSENCSPKKKKNTAKRTLFENDHITKKRKIADDVYFNTEENSYPSQKRCKIQLSKQDTTKLQSAKQAFHTSIPSRLVGRQREIEVISNFLNSNLNEKNPGSLYISGAPGTGKTSSLKHVINTMKEKIISVFINCMSVNNASTVYKLIAEELKLPKSVISSKNVSKSIEKHIVTSNTMIVLILDEIDHLDSKGQEVLYSLFEWPQLPNSSVILIGIANALDLTDRVLPRLHAFNYEPQLLHFQPYTRDQIIAILQDRLSEVKNSDSPIIKPVALQLCARKIAACTGDIRKALDVCRRAIEIVENQTRQQLALKFTSDDRCNPGSPKKRLPQSFKSVDLQQINAVLHEIYGSRIQSSSLSSKSETVTLPLQQVIVLCTLILMKKNCKIQDFNLAKLYEVYRRVCKKRQMVEVDESEFHNLCRLVESRGLIELKKNKVARMSKVSLRIDESEAEHVLHDKTLLAAVLADPSVVKSNGR